MCFMLDPRCQISEETARTLSECTAVTKSGTGTWDGDVDVGLGQTTPEFVKKISVVSTEGVICWRACRVTLHRRRSSKVGVHGNFGQRGNCETCEYCESP